MAKSKTEQEIAEHTITEDETVPDNLNDFFFPSVGRTIKAATYEEAVKLLKSSIN